MLFLVLDFCGRGKQRAQPSLAARCAGPGEPLRRLSATNVCWEPVRPWDTALGVSASRAVQPPRHCVQ